jgi:hypothetical protein
MVEELATVLGATARFKTQFQVWDTETSENTWDKLERKPVAF